MIESEKEQLIQKLANATVTNRLAGGRLKADENKAKALEYGAQLFEAGEGIPSDMHLLSIGVFNGEGAW